MSDEDAGSSPGDFSALWRTAIVVEVHKDGSVTVIEQGRPMTVGSTDDAALAIDRAQYVAREGPCLDAAQERRVVRIDDTEEEQRWPTFTASARAKGIRSSLSLPLILSSQDTVAGFNIYGSLAGGFTDDDQQLCEAFAAQASIVVSIVQAYWTVFELARGLSKAMASRAII